MEGFFSLPSKSISRAGPLLLLMSVVFFITFREALETAIIVSVLLALIHRTPTSSDGAVVNQKLVNQVRSQACLLVTCALDSDFSVGMAWYSVRHIFLRRHRRRRHDWCARP